MTRSKTELEPVERYRERLTASPVALVAVVFICLAFALGPAQLYGVVIRGDEPMWPRMFLVGIGFGFVMAIIIAVWSHRTVVIVDDQAIRCLDRTIPLDSIRSWVRVEGRSLRGWRKHLLSDQGSNWISMGVWALRGGRNKAFAPPWMPAGILLRGLGEPVLVGTRYPQRFLAAIHAAQAEVRTHAVRGDQSWDAAGPEIPPEFRWPR